MDAVIGLSLIGLLLATLAAAGIQHRRATLTFEARRQAVRQLEIAAARLRAGQPLGDSVDTVTQHPAGERWTRLTMPAANGEVELFVASPPRKEAP